MDVADKLVWRIDVEKAIEETKPGKLIVLVQFDFDFLKPVLDSKEFKNFQQHALDSEACKWLNDNSVLICQGVGFPYCFELTFSKAYERQEQKSGKPKQQSIGTCVTWLCDSEGVVYDVLVGLPESKLFIERSKAISQFLKKDGVPLREDKSNWHQAKLVKPDQDLFLRLQQELIAHDKFSKHSLTDTQSVKYAVAAAVRAREFRMQERFGKNWNRKLLSRFASLENQFFSMMLAVIPFKKYDALSQEVWKAVLGQRTWEVDRAKLTEWIETQRAEKRAILLRINEGEPDNKKWPPASRSKLVKLVKPFALLDDVSAADAAFLLDYFGAAPVSVSANHEPKYFLSTSRGDVYHLLTTEDDNQLSKRLKAINTIEAMRK